MVRKGDDAASSARYGRRMWVRVLAIASLLALAGCATTAGAPDPSAPICRQETAETFRIDGAIDPAMAACVAAAWRPTTRVLVLDSPGGDVATALDMAARFEGQGLEMRVDGECNSSCANYFLPLARRVVVEPGSVVMLHGSVDPALRARMTEDRAGFLRDRIAAGATPEEAQAAFDAGVARIDAMIARQDEWARRHGVPPGWLLYREPGSTDVVGIEGEPDGDVRRGLLVEEAMMRSCLPGVEVAPYRSRFGSGPINALRALVVRLRGFAWSGAMRCVA